MKSKISIIKLIPIVGKLFRYNMRIIFANKFVYFLVAAIIFFLTTAIINLFTNPNQTEEEVYGLLLTTGILLIFYPSAFGIQNDSDSRMLEIIFGIPNYRYKVWLVRLIMIFVIVAMILLVLSFVSSFIMVRISNLDMVFQLMFPLFFLACLAFMFSTIIRNGNGTAVVMIIFGLLFLIFSDFLDESKWNVFLNPYLSTDMNETIWRDVCIKNRLYLLAGGIITILYGLFNLQHREKFV